MISPCFFIDKLGLLGVDFFAGVPDSLLKNICAYISDNIDDYHNFITANEGGAIGLAAGYHLSTGKIACVYMQNSGEGNIINPLASLTDKEVYNIPVMLLIGWRGQPGVHDEPQHVKQGKITKDLLDVMGIRYAVLSKEENIASQQLEAALASIKATGEVYALLVEKDTFTPYTIECSKGEREDTLSMTREEAIQIVAGAADANDVIVGTTGMISRELFEYRESMKESHERDFLTVGAMGHASQIALGIAIEKQDRRVWCFDGDGAVIMHMGGMAIVASKSPKNYIHVIFNNGAHDSVGGQPTVGLNIDVPAIAKAVGYKDSYRVTSREHLIETIANLSKKEGPILLEIQVKKGSRKELGRPTTTPVQNKQALMNFLNCK